MIQHVAPFLTAIIQVPPESDKDLFLSPNLWNFLEFCCHLLDAPFLCLVIRFSNVSLWQPRNEEVFYATLIGRISMLCCVNCVSSKVA